MTTRQRKKSTMRLANDIALSIALHVDAR